jgi:lipopolysaccharide transport system ATP-binding protein
MKAIEIRDLCKIYSLYERPIDRIGALLSGGRWRRPKEFYALDGINLEVEAGEVLCLIGENGSGKSTLLRIIAGLLRPSRGQVVVRGRIGALLELSAGLSRDFSGRENALFKGTLLGLSREEMIARMPEIEAFAELGEFFDRPVRTYSSGMAVRLGFAVAVTISPDVLLIDEALSVGDLYFQHKCLARMNEFKEQGKTILLVTHDLGKVRGFSGRALLLEGGRIDRDGDPEEVSEEYLKRVQVKRSARLEKALRAREKKGGLPRAKIRFGAEGGWIERVKLLDASGQETCFLHGEDPLRLEILALSGPEASELFISLVLRDQRGVNICGASSDRLGLALKADEKGRVRVIFTLRLRLNPGSYSFLVRFQGRKQLDNRYLIEKQAGVGVFEVLGDRKDAVGILDAEAEVEQLVAEDTPTS